MYYKHDARTRFASLSAPVGLLLGLLVMPAPAMPAGADRVQPGGVGQVSLVIGQAYRVGENGKRLLIRSGDRIASGERIETAANGHVHIRFDDHGLVSVRPLSRLVINQYRYNAGQPDQSTVKFDLQQGVMRSVSGRAAKAARERFRLNTPMAAIGVRGTDFVVRVDEQFTRAIVNEGTIVVAPFSDQCLAESLGPCSSNAVALSGGDNQLLELNRLQPTPRLLPLSEGMMPDLSRQRGDGEREVAERPESAYPEHGGDERQQLYGESLVNRALSGREEEGAVDSPSRSELLRQRQLVWGRWSSAPAPEDSLVLGYAEASEGRRVAIGNNQLGLFRAQPGSSRVNPGLGGLTFNLDAAQATYTGATGVTTAMQVDDGSLGIDFTTNRFQTSLGLSSSATGAVRLNADGRIDEAGYFNSRGATQQVVGAVSIDGREAAYLFNKQLPAGQVDGVTLWGVRQP